MSFWAILGQEDILSKGMTEKRIDKSLIWKGVREIKPRNI